MKNYIVLLLVSFVTFSFSQKKERPEKVQLRFIENKGQWDDKTTFRLQAEDLSIFYAQHEIGYFLLSQEFHQHDHSHAQGHYHDRPDKIHGHRFIVKHINSSTTYIEGINELAGNFNYLLGDDPNKWGKSAKSYTGIIYHDLYEGIDYTVNQYRHLVKTEYRIKAGADPSSIKLSFQGLQGIRVDNGRLILKTSVRDLIEKKPFAYQVINQDTVKVNCSYQLKDKTLSYQLGAYDKNYELIIDPELIFSTYSGVTNDNWGSTACPDNNGNTYAGGIIFIDDDEREFPVSTGAFQTEYQGGIGDVLILKLDSLGTNLLYATYLGGNGLEVPSSIAVDPSTNQLVGVVTTGSLNFPTTEGVYQKDFSGGEAVVGNVDCAVSPLVSNIYDFSSGTDYGIFKLSEDGSELIASTYLGGNGNDGLMYTLELLTKNYGDQFRTDIYVDEEGTVYLAGVTKSSDFPTRNANNSTLGGTTSGVYVKLRDDLKQLLVGTYIGGSGYDAAYSIKVDDQKNTFVAGGTTTSNMFNSFTGFDKTYNGSIDGFIVKFNEAGQMLSGSYFGTSSYDQIYFIDLDDQNNIYAYGQTEGFIRAATFDNNIATPNVGYGAGNFIFKMNGNLSNLLWQTTVGERRTSGTVNPLLSPSAFRVNDCGQILFAGWGGSGNYYLTNVECVRNNSSSIESRGYVGRREMYSLIVTPDAFLTDTDGSDFYLSVLSEDAQSIVYATFFGDVTGYHDHVDGGTSRFSKNGVVYHNTCAGCLGSNGVNLYSKGGQGDFPRGNLGGGLGQCNNGIFKFNLTELDLALEIGDCQGNEVTITNVSTGGIQYTLTKADGGIIDDNFDEGETVTITSNVYVRDSVFLTSYNPSSCPASKTEKFYISFSEKRKPVFIRDTTCADDSLVLVVPSYGTDMEYRWLPETPILSNINRDSALFISDTSARFFITVKDQYDCQSTDTFDVVVYDPQLTIDLELEGNCDGDYPSVQVTNTSKNYSTIEWTVNNNQRTRVDKLDEIKFEEFGDVTVDIGVREWKCIDTTRFDFTLHELEVPNIVTPNSDGDNDTFAPIGLEDNGNWHLEVYNRWGKRIFEKENYINEWDASDQEDGVYYYLLTAPDESFCKGWVQVVR